jgi:hypothetical protein
VHQLGGELEQLGKLWITSSEARARAAAVQYDSELATETQRILYPTPEEAMSLSDEDRSLPRRLERFDQVKKDLVSKYRPTGLTGSPAVFDLRASASDAEHAGRLRSVSYADAMDDIKNGAEIERTAVERKIATAETPEELAIALGEGVHLADELVANGAMRPADAQLFKQKGLENAFGMMVKVNPIKAFEFVDDMPFDDATKKLYKAQAITELGQLASAERTQRRQEEADRDRAENQISDDLEESMLLDAESGTLTADEVRANRELLSTGAVRRLLKSIGGEGGSGKLNRDVYDSLSTAVMDGDPVDESIRDAFANSDIGKTERDSLLSLSRTRRFVDTRKYIDTAFSSDKFDFTSQGKKVQALQYFDDWVDKHPNASREEARDKANQLIASGDDGIAEPTRSLLRPLGAIPMPGDPKYLDLNASKLKLEYMRASGELTQDEYEEERKKLGRFATAQKAAIARAASYAKPKASNP